MTTKIKHKDFEQQKANRLDLNPNEVVDNTDNQAKNYGYGGPSTENFPITTAMVRKEISKMIEFIEKSKKSNIRTIPIYHGGIAPKLPDKGILDFSTDIEVARERAKKYGDKGNIISHEIEVDHWKPTKDKRFQHFANMPMMKPGHHQYRFQSGTIKEATEAKRNALANIGEPLQKEGVGVASDTSTSTFGGGGGKEIDFFKVKGKLDDFIKKAAGEPRKIYIHPEKGEKAPKGMRIQVSKRGKHFYYETPKMAKERLTNIVVSPTGQKINKLKVKAITYVAKSIKERIQFKYIPLPSKMNPNPGEARVYSKAYLTKAVVDNHKRLSKIDKLRPRIQKAILSTAGKDPTPTALYLVMKTVLRIGNLKSAQRSNDPTFGISTLQPRHVKLGSGNKVYFRFQGKDNHENKKMINDPIISSWIKGHINDKYLFDTDEGKVLTFLRKIAGTNDINIRDFRNWEGTSLALEKVKKMPKPDNLKDLKKAIMEVAKEVSEELCNTPGTALRNYISPMVWMDNWGVDIHSIYKSGRSRDFLSNDNEFSNWIDSVQFGEEENDKIEKSNDLKMSAKAIIINKDKFLIIKDKDSDSWGLPGGHIQDGETSNEAIKREVKEEIGLEIDKLDEIGIRELHFDDGGKWNTIFFRASSEDQDIDLSKESEKFKWILPQEVKNYNLNAYKEIIKEEFGIVKKERKGHWEGRHWIADKGYEPEWKTKKYPEKENPNFDPKSETFWAPKIEKSKIYLKEGELAPKGVQIFQGERGGKYYESVEEDFPIKDQETEKKYGFDYKYENKIEDLKEKASITNVEIWYNRETRDWVVQAKDKDGNQVGTTEYTYHKKQAAKDKEYIINESEKARQILDKMNVQKFINDLLIKTDMLSLNNLVKSFYENSLNDDSKSVLLYKLLEDRFFKENNFEDIEELILKHIGNRDDVDEILKEELDLFKHEQNNVYNAEYRKKIANGPYQPSSDKEKQEISNTSDVARKLESLKNPNGNMKVEKQGQLVPKDSVEHYQTKTGKQATRIRRIMVKPKTAGVEISSKNLSDNLKELRENMNFIGSNARSFHSFAPTQKENFLETLNRTDKMLGRTGKQMTAEIRAIKQKENTPFYTHESPDNPINRARSHIKETIAAVKNNSAGMVAHHTTAFTHDYEEALNKYQEHARKYITKQIEELISKSIEEIKNKVIKPKESMYEEENPLKEKLVGDIEHFLEKNKVRKSIDNLNEAVLDNPSASSNSIDEFLKGYEALAILGKDYSNKKMDKLFILAINIWKSESSFPNEYDTGDLKAIRKNGEIEFK